MDKKAPCQEPSVCNESEDIEVPDAFEAWIAAFFDGEGTIKSHARKANDNVIGYGVNPQCQIVHQYVGGMFDAEGCIKTGPVQAPTAKLGYHPFIQTVISNNDDALVGSLELFAEHIGVDCKIYHNKNEGDENWDPTFTFQIQKLEDVETFLQSIQPYLIVKREQARIMLNEIIPLIKNGTHLKKEGFLEVMYYVDQINKGKGGNRGKYNLEYFEDLWGVERQDTEWF